MQRKWILRTSLILALVFAISIGSTASAGSFHFNSVEFSLGSLIMNGDLLGLGNQVAQVQLTGYGTVTAMCENKGGQQAPGRNPLSIHVKHTELFVTDSNGRALVMVETPDPILADFNPSPTPKEAGCPNSNWSVVGIVDGSTNWTAATIIVKDEAGAVQLTLNYTCTTYFENGVGVSITCSGE